MPVGHTNPAQQYSQARIDSETRETSGIVKSIFEFNYDGKNLNIKDITCKTEGDACKYERENTSKI